MGAPWPAAAAERPGAGKERFDLHERARFWSFQALKAVPPPAVQQRDWPCSPLDAFVLARLEAAGSRPAPAADKRTLIRRLSFDLLGLPPAPAEVDAFLADDSPDAYERLVDRLLASPHYGERWGRHWLDLVRYAETCGHEFDADLPDAWRYRDYVIRAFNDDLPYDRFVVEHVAGDLLPRPRYHPADGTNESIVATGFWFLGEAKHSPVDVRADQADRIDNQLDVFGKTFLGLTVACARCHDHKFDPIPQADYYALCGYLRSSRYQQAFLDRPERSAPLLRRLTGLRAEADALAVAVSANALRGQLEGLVDGVRSGRVRLPDSWLQPAPAAQAAGTVFADFARDGFRGWYVTGQAFGDGPAQGIVQRAGVPPVQRVVGPGWADSRFPSGVLQGALRSPTFTLQTKRIWYHAAGREARINLIVDGYQHIRDPIYGGLTVRLKSDEPRWLAQDVGMWTGHRAYIEILDDGPGYAVVDRIVFRDDGPPEEPANPLLAPLVQDAAPAAPDALARKVQPLCQEIVAQWRTGALRTAPDAGHRIAILNELLQGDWLRPLSAAPDAEHARRLARLEALREQIRTLEASLPAPRRAMALADGTGENEHLFIRGNHKNLGDEVPRRFLEVLAGTGQPAPRQGSGRLELAERLVHPSNPLLPRVLVNRLWQHHFGEGIVRSPDSFGALGTPPTHPELLDYLATEFVRRGWSVKELHRLMLLSSTFRMASRGDPAAERQDPENKLLHRMPVRRLEAEAIRDAMLCVSGRMERTLYGPGVPTYLTPFMLGRGRPEQSGPLDGAGRRSVYLAVRRNFLTPMFLAFDYPTPFTTIGRRSVSNVPAQALTLMNNPFVVQQAERWARRVLAEPAANGDERLTRLYLLAFGRPPSEDEVRDARGFLEEQGRQYDGPADVRVWADLCHVLLNVKEFIFVN
jgi:hypothetical protein